MTQVESPSPESPRLRSLVVKLVWLSTIVVALHPVAADGVWWELAKGRAVTQGSLHPTASLISGTVSAEGPWLSGLLPYLLFTYFGDSGLMSLKLVAAVLVTGLLLGRVADAGFEQGRAMFAASVTAVTVLASREAWEPGPLLVDAVASGLVMVTALRAASSDSLRTWVIPLVLLVLWANCGERSAAGAVIVALAALSSGRGFAAGLGLSGLAITMTAATPAGARGVVDSIVVMFPQLLEPADILSLSGWSPWWAAGWRAESLAFTALTGLFLWQSRRQLSWSQLLALFGVQVLAAGSSSNLPVAGVWLAMTMLNSGRSRIGETECPRPFVTGQPMLATTGETRQDADSNRFPAVWAAGVMAGVIGLAVQPWSGCASGVGWGMDPRLDSEAFLASLDGVALRGSAHCVGLREAGMMAWHAKSDVKPFDTPDSALRSRRLRSHVLLTSDLSAGWQVRHPRADGSHGGWWTVCQERGITALVVPSESLNLIAALEPSLWKPLSLTAVCVVYGRTGDPDCSQRIVQGLSLRSLVDRGAWTYQSAAEEGLRPLEFLPGSDARVAVFQGLRLARMFRAMGLSVAALKVLHGLPIGSTQALRAEFFENQLRLGYRERVSCGRSSELRMQAALLTQPEGVANSSVQDVLVSPGDIVRTSGDPALSTPIRAYVAGDLEGALKQWPSESVESLYARAWLELEAGNPAAAQQSLDGYLQKHLPHRLERPARLLRESLAN